MKPLFGLQLLTIALNLPGPIAVARLLRLGAKAVKIEPPAGDPLAVVSPGYYAELHKEVEVHRIDLKAERGQVSLHSILAQTDLLITSSRPAALARLGLDWTSLSLRYQNLCQVAIIGYPPPDEGRAGHDLTYQASLGLLEPPHMPRVMLADLAGAEWAVSAALALLLGRERVANDALRDGYERCVQVSLADAAAAFAEPLQRGLTGPGGLLGGGLPGYNLYRAQEGWVAIAAIEPHFLQRLAEELGLTEITQESLTEAFSYRSATYWEEWAAKRDLPLAAVPETGAFFAEAS